MQQLKTRFKRTVRWSKYRLEISHQSKNNNLNYLIDPTFRKVNRLFALLFVNEGDRMSFSKCNMPTLQINCYNALINKKSFFDIPVKNK